MVLQLQQESQHAHESRTEAISTHRHGSIALACRCLRSSRGRHRRIRSAGGIGGGSRGNGKRKGHRAYVEVWILVLYIQRFAIGRIGRLTVSRCGVGAGTVATQKYEVGTGNASLVREVHDDALAANKLLVAWDKG